MTPVNRGLGKHSKVKYLNLLLVRLKSFVRRLSLTFLMLLLTLMLTPSSILFLFSMLALEALLLAPSVFPSPV